MKQFPKILNQIAFNKVVDRLADDVELYGGSATQVIFMYRSHREVTVCQVPWGTLTIVKPISKLEALAISLEKKL